ncbi:hypothetical protein LNN38_21140 [Pseudomonas sp. LA21]|uniref:hypothetical protein n=1 Tax=Pseudomonas sp. LA21 TaxID=2893373 RepID=UPI001FB59ED5|nr:hypothetical protein [Pseudomonas sp. LA21]MCJ1887380.1 hypothetical protein [Pseudomonas sp. LA21]
MSKDQPKHSEQAEGAQGEREAFEAWHCEKFKTKWTTGAPTRDKHNGVYDEDYGPKDQQLAWEAWQARAALAQPYPAPALRAGVDVAGNRFEVPVQGWDAPSPPEPPVECPHHCGSVYTKDSYGAGFIEGSGMCPDCDAEMPPKDIVQAEQVPQAWLDVQAERRRQIDEEGWPAADDDQNKPGELAQAAAAYLLYAVPRGHSDLKFASRLWPWISGFRPQGSRNDLVRGVALGLAALERLDRAAALAQGGG